MTERFFIEADTVQRQKNGQLVSGDAFYSRRYKETGRVISVLSDGLGSGIKASVLATLTATMACRFAGSGMDVRRAAEVIMRTLPVCRERRISYSTFTIVDVTGDNRVRIIEYDNPPYILLRGGLTVTVDKKPLQVETPQATRRISYSEFTARAGDRIVFFSDGVSQSGMGTGAMPLGWGNKAAVEYAQSITAGQPLISARELAHGMVAKALANDVFRARDDTSCGVFYFREPRRLLIASGPPFNPARDAELARRLAEFPGRKAVAGGTTSSIIAREWNRTVEVVMTRPDRRVPPHSRLEGLDLVTEGIITLGAASGLLEAGHSLTGERTGPAALLANLLLESDCIHFLVGTRINEAHQDPSMPVELEIRRNVIKKTVRLLEEKYLKDVKVEYI